MGLTFEEFLNLFSKGKIDLHLSKVELLNLFNTIDTNRNGIISTDEFLEWFNRFTKLSEKEQKEKEQRTHVLNEVTNFISSYNMKFEQSNKINPEAETNYRNFINEIVIEEKDYVKGIKSILRDPFKALKVAQTKADRVIKLREKAQKSGNENYKEIFFVDEDFCITTNLEAKDSTDDQHRRDSPADYEGKNCLQFTDMKKEYICSDAQNWKHIQWLRPYEIVHKRGVTETTENPEDLVPTFFAQKVESKDVNQGLLGDCWLLAAMSIVAVRTEHLRGNVGMTAAQLDRELSDTEVISI